jgi:RNA polymerase sigma factor (sigma-70 family)
VSALADTSSLWKARPVTQSREQPAPHGGDPVFACVRGLQAGDKAQLEPLIEHTQALAWRLAYAILQDRQEVEDALQDVYLLVYQNIGQLQQHEAFYGWFKRIVVHRCLRLRQKSTPTQALTEETPAPALELEPGLDLRQAFRRLNEADRTVLGLREILDLPYEEISGLLQVPLSTVKARLYNARQRLCRFLSGQGGGSVQ